MSHDEMNQSVNFWMKVVGSLVSTVVVGMMSWMTLTLQDMSVRMAVVETSVIAIKQQPTISVDSLALRDQRITRNEQWLENLSRRLSDLERDFRARDARDNQN